MERKNTNWLTIVIVAAFAVCGGFVAGSMLGIRERSQLKARNGDLAKSESTIQSTLLHSKAQNAELLAQLDEARSDVAQCRAEYGRLETAADRRIDPLDDFHPPMVWDFAPFDAKSRIVELECEVATLKELVGKNGGMAPEDTPPTAASGVRLAKSPEPLAEKQQCSATTKKGIRCSRQARSNGKCWQHGG